MEKLPTIAEFEYSNPLTRGEVFSLRISKDAQLTISFELDDLPEGPPLQYDGKYDPKANDLESVSKAKFIQADEAYYRATNGGKHIAINSGKRSVRHQAELWIGFREGKPGYNKANLPGCSLHNYGTAIDIIREGNVEWIEAALNKYGWQRTVDDEGWHYECLDSPAHARVQPTINALRAGKAGAWAQAYFQAKKDEEEQLALGQRLQPRIDKFKRDVDAFNAAADQHNKQANYWVAQVEQWKADRAALQVRIDNFNSRVAYANNLANQINGMPAGPERDRLYAQWVQLRQEIEAERPNLAAAIDAMNMRAVALEQEGNRLQSQKQALEAELTRLQQERQAIIVELNRYDALGKSVTDNRNKMATLLTEIEQTVG